MGEGERLIDLELTYIKNPDGSRKPSIPENLRLAAIEFVRTNGRQPAAQIEGIVDAGHRSIMSALDRITETQAAYKPAPDDWSVLELMAHVVSTKQIVGTLATALAQGALPPGFGPALETQATQDGVTVARFGTLAEARAAADDAHAVMMALVRGLDAPVNTDLQFKHYIFGAFNCREWAVFQRVHDDNHAPQVSAIKASAGFPLA